jgi:hypothetical protein
MATSATFGYKLLLSPENIIRLITLLPGSDSTVIQCQLFTQHLAGKPRFDALSYMWGEPDQLGLSITVDDKNFAVRKSLWDALFFLREATEARVLWIDAICINQDDLEERSCQVRQMRRIFEQAENVLAWVGTKSHNSDLAIATLRELGSFGIRRREELFLGTDAWGKWNAVFDFFLRRYWSRVWIIQELAMGRVILICCGRDIIPWDYLSEALMTVEWLLRTKQRIKFSKPVSSKEEWTTMLSGICDTHPLQLHRQRARRSADYSGPFDVNVLLGLAHKSACSDPLDRVYALLGITDNKAIPIDYKKNMFELYVDMIKHMRNEEVRGPPTIQEFLTVQFSQCTQALLRGPHPNITKLVKYVDVKGVCGDTILNLGPTYHSSRSGVFSLDDALGLAAQFYRDSREIGCHKRYRLQKYGRSLQKRLRTFWPVSVVRSIKPSAFSAYKKCQPISKELITALISWNSTSQATRGVSERPVNLGTRRPQQPRFFLGDKGQVGLVPSQAQPGDLICRFFGSDSTTILRQDAERSSYSLVGRALILREQHETRGKGGGFASSAKFLIGSIPQRHQIEGLKEFLDIRMDIETLQDLTYDSYRWY